MLASSSAVSVEGTVTRLPVASHPAAPAEHAIFAGSVAAPVSSACGAVVRIVSRPVQPAAGPPGFVSAHAGSPMKCVVKRGFCAISSEFNIACAMRAISAMSSPLPWQSFGWVGSFFT